MVGGLEVFLDEMWRKGRAHSLSLSNPPSLPGPVPADVPWPPPHFEWWNAVEVKREKEEDEGGNRKAFVYQGFEETLDFVSSVLDSQGPFDGFLAFSQGTILASLLLAAWSKVDEAREKAEEEEGGRGGGGGGGAGRRAPSSSGAATSSTSSSSLSPPLVLPPRLAGLKPSARPRFAVLVSGVWAKAPICSALEREEEREGGEGGARWTRREGGSGSIEAGGGERPRASSPAGGCIRAPSLHVIGQRDYVSPLSRRLAEAFVNSVVVEYPGGHVIPRLPPEELATLRAFLRSQAQASASSL